MCDIIYLNERKRGIAMERLERAKRILFDGDFTCAGFDGESTLCSKRRGVAPLIEILDSGKSVTRYAFADKVVGAGAAFLYVKLGVRMLYADVISERALDVLKGYGVYTQYREAVPYIRNRAGDGKCPMETAVQGIEDADTAVRAIREKLKELSAK